MNDRLSESAEPNLWSVDLFVISSLEDEIRSDKAIQRLLRLHYLHLVENETPPEDAGALTRGADYFLRDFIISDRKENVLRFSSGRVRQFAGNWYIIKNLEPNAAELGTILTGIKAFFEFAAEQGKIDSAALEEIRKECADFDFYLERIEAFEKIEGDGFTAWNGACPIKD